MSAHSFGLDLVHPFLKTQDPSLNSTVRQTISAAFEAGPNPALPSHPTLGHPRGYSVGTAHKGRILFQQVPRVSLLWPAPSWPYTPPAKRLQICSPNTVRHPQVQWAWIRLPHAHPGPCSLPATLAPEDQPRIPPLAHV